MTIRRSGTGLLLVLSATWACADGTPTSQDPNLVPVDAETYEVFLPFEVFASDFQTFRGFGSVTALGSPILANGWTHGEPDEGTLEARPLVRFGFLPDSIFVPSPDGGETQVDKDFVPVSGTLTVFFDTTGVDVDEFPAMNVTASATETSWDRPSASWEMAVDTVGERTAWPEPGGGPMRAIGTSEWLAVESDSVTFEIDSLSVTEWTTPGIEHGGLILTTDSENVRIRIREIDLRVQVRPSVDPDTLIQIGPVTRQFTFLYDPSPEGQDGGFIVGGAPASRAVVAFDLPGVLDGGPEICDFVPCPFDLTRDRVLFASLVLTSDAVTPGALRPRSPFNLAARVVLAPDRLPRSPLGRSVQPQLREIASAAFGEEGGTAIEIPMTRYIQELVEALENPDATTPRHVAFLAPNEPSGLEVGAFAPPGGPGAPRLRLILTLSEGVTLP